MFVRMHKLSNWKKNVQLSLINDRSQRGNVLMFMGDGAWVVREKVTVRHQSCHCRKVWRGTCSSECTLSQVSSDRIEAMGQSARSSESKISAGDREKKGHKECSYIHKSCGSICSFSSETHLDVDAEEYIIRQGATADMLCFTFPQLLQWCFLRMTVNGALHAMQELQASSGTHSGGSVGRGEKY